ncbi:efflux RND transporter periplasmic adaptor subunit [Paenibacillus mendelii]|uniref:Efflux RND transporter periplasmic adaptor subunit n=1 Tax=Paenibacillus mendelii TaxID=206163 RepID=A0ABV6JB97_9BACL|nr:efflux RND transporter periplasmic adaptor subunit [Paenibacillus mendelii]MCQ6558527.1 efflux RND transporter periplasmic adaptor subunit [Paenibacillus mendelii]
MSYNQTRKGHRALLVSTIITISAMLSGCSLLPQGEQSLKPPLIKPAQEKIDAVEVKKGKIERVFFGTATIASSEVVPVFYKDSGGRLKDVYVRQGEQVKAGQLIAELETGNLNMQIELQKLNVERVQIEYNRARRAQADENEIRLRQIDLERETISLNSIQQQYDAARLVAPIGGVITFLDEIHSGDGVTGYRPIVNIADPNQLHLVYESEDKKDISPVQINMDVEITIKKEKLKGKVIQSPSGAPLAENPEQAERNSKRLLVSFDPGKLEVGMGLTADIRIVLEKQEDVIVIPRSGLRTYMGRNYVQVLDGERRKEVDVEPGIMTSTEVEIRMGLEPGQKVILNN